MALSLIADMMLPNFVRRYFSPTALDGSPRRRWGVILPLALFLVIFGTKASVIDRFGSDLPYWDQWPGEGTVTFLPWLEHHEFWKPLVTPHNEHRIAPTRVLSLGLLLVGGQWDARVQCLVNAALHAGIVVLFFLWLRRRLSAGWSVTSALLLAVTFAPPIPWENVLAGFQSQFYFLILLSLLGLGGMLYGRPFSFRWFAGLACCAIAILTMGSGFLCGLPIVAIAGMRFLGERRRWTHLTTAVAAIAILAVGAWLYRPVGGHAVLKAKTLGEFLGYAARGLSWPWPQWRWLWLVFWLPWVALLGARLHAFKQSAPDADFQLAAGIWILLQTAAVSYARGGGSELPSARYGDVTGLGLTLGFAILAIYAARTRSWMPRIAAWCYGAVAAAALVQATHAVYHTVLPQKKQENLDYERNINGYLLTDDFSYLKGRRIPFPWPEWLRDNVLHVPKLRALLPASVRLPLRLTALTETDATLPNRAVRMIGRGEHWESKLLPTGKGWWLIETKGDLGQRGTSLAIVGADGRVLSRVVPSRIPGQSWRGAYVPAPRVPATLVAETDRASEFAFSEPVEMSSLSYGFRWLGRQGTWCLILGGTLLLLVVVLELLADTTVNGRHDNAPIPRRSQPDAC